MKFICLTHVDAHTKVPCTVEPMRTGPSFPEVDGLVVLWANESDWPTYTPIFFGTCADAADTDIPGVFEVLDEAEYDRRFAHELMRRWEVTKQRFRDAVHQRLDSFAMSRGYSSILSACSYLNSTVPQYRAEAERAIEARDLTWAKLFEIIAEMEAGTREKTQSFHEFADELPELVWPA